MRSALEWPVCAEMLSKGPLRELCICRLQHPVKRVRCVATQWLNPQYVGPPQEFLEMPIVEAIGYISDHASLSALWLCIGTILVDPYWDSGI